MIPFQKEANLIQSIPGISKINASAILAEIGTDMSQFPDEAHLSSWARVCPGNNESAGKKESGKPKREIPF
ncbi:Transposase IS116/IS110/IS902 family protein [uncultured archaeon]|nr:Transposase IS116/IS110/IS902 family protein [uncultured archaeon]